MLEKSRILQYHIFGSVLYAPQHIKLFLKMDDRLFESAGQKIPPNMCLEELDKEFECILPSKKYGVYQFIGGIICLSKITFHMNVDGKSEPSLHAINEAARLFSIDKEELLDVLTTRTITVPGENGGKIWYSYTLYSNNLIESQQLLIQIVFIVCSWMYYKLNVLVIP